MAGSRAAWLDPAWKYRRKIVVDPGKMPGADLRDFPLLVSLTDPSLRSPAHGGRAGSSGAGDFRFTASDGTTRLQAEIQAYDPASGSLRAWVRIPNLIASGVAIHLYYGNPSPPADPDAGSAWDAGYRLVLHAASSDRESPDSTSFGNHGVPLRRREGTAVKVAQAESLSLKREITVEAWVDGANPRTDALQAVVSRWSLRSEMDRFEAWDAGDTDGLNTKGFFGAVFDGRYVYFVPQYDGTLTDGKVVRHGKVLRYDTRGTFRDRRSWSAWDAGATSGLNTKGYYGAVATKRYVYFVPRTDGEAHHSRLLRYDRTGDFKDPRSWSAHDAGVAVSYQSAAYDGRFIYFAPGYEGPGKPSGKVLRYDTAGALEDPKSYAVYDAGDTSGLNARCFDGAVFDERFVYFSPLDPIGIILRHDTRGEFQDPGSWTARDAGGTSGLSMGQCVGAIYDGRYVYFVPYANSVVVRYDVRAEFADPAAWQAMDAGGVSGLGTRGYDGAAFDGRYIYFIPFWEGGDIHAGFHGQVLRYDTKGSFSDVAAWDARDAGATDGLKPVGFNGGAFDGRYLYFAPWREGTDPDGGMRAHGHVLRYDTTGTGASFSLRFTDCGHNGGLCAALPGPAFLVNTERGVLNARADRVLGPGPHHLAGVYDGRTIRLYVDGALECEGEGGGSMLSNETDVLIGGIQDGLGDLHGTISEVRISGVARSADWIRTGHAIQRTPGAFLRIENEEDRFSDRPWTDTSSPPVARRIVREKTVHGELRVDEYDWLRDRTDPEVIAYLEAENAYTAEALKPAEALQQAIYEEILSRTKQTDLSVPYRLGGFWYYTRTEEGRQYPLYCRRPGSMDAGEQVLLDLNALAEGHGFLGLGVYQVSDDGHLLAYSLDFTGFRQYRLFLKDLRTGEVLPDDVGHVNTVAWASDNRTLFYVTEDAAKRPYRLHRHVLGGERDDLLFEETDALYKLRVYRSSDRRFLLMVSASSITTETRALSSDDPGGAFEVLLPRTVGHEYDVDHREGLYYIRTNREAKNFRLVSAPANAPGPENWVERIPHRPAVKLETFLLFKDHAVFVEREDALIRFRVHDFRTGRTEAISFDEPVYAAFSGDNPEFDTATFRFHYQSMVTPPSVFDWDMRNGGRTLLKQTEVLGGYDPTRYASERIHAVAGDGARIPISLVFRKGMVRDGSNPLLLYGYGSYGSSQSAAFSIPRLSLLDRGMVYAIAHIRGGGDLGEEWHDQGKMRRKRNTFTDFIACAEHLVREGYTSTERLAIQGGSAGGLLIGAVLNMRPDLFRAAHLAVPFVDVINTMLDASLPLTVGEYLEWGNPNVQEEYDYLRTYCPYTNLEPKAYPDMLVTTSLNDSQVMYWEPAKYVARLRTLKTDRNLLLLKTNMGAGHGGASGRYDAFREQAMIFAFLMSRVGIAV